MIDVGYSDPYFLLSFPYNEVDLAKVKALPVRDWRKKEKIWRVHKLAALTLKNLPANWSKDAAEARERVERLLTYLVDFKFDQNIEAHDGLFPYQERGTRFLRYARKAFLNDDMGLGKTIQSIAAVLKANVDSCLILCPASLKWNWEFQFQKHFNIQPLVIHGNAQTRQEQWASDDVFKISNYDILTRDWEYIPRKWDAIIADEVVALKNGSAQRTKLARRLKSDIRYGLSGTAWELNLLEFHSIMQWIRPEILPNFWNFQRRYCSVDHWGKINGYKNLGELHLLTSPFILRRTKAEVLPELPPKIYSDIPLEMPEAMAKQYNALAGTYLHTLKEKGAKANPLTATIRMRQFVEFPSIIGYEDEVHPRLQWLKDVHEEAPKVVVFTFFKTSANKLAEIFNTKYLLTGDTPKDKRLPMVQEFNEQDRAILISTDAGRFGLDMVGADVIVHYGYFFNPATMIQREDRLHRIGQLSTVQVMRPFYTNSVDVGIRKIYMDRQESEHDFSEGSQMMSRLKLSMKDFEMLAFGA